MTQDNLKKISEWREEVGYSSSKVANDFLNGWFSLYRLKFVNVLARDADLLNLTYGEYAKILYDDQELPPYPQGRQLIRTPEEDPLYNVVLPDSGIEKVYLDNVTLGTLNYVLFKVVRRHTQTDKVNYISRVFHDNIRRNWQSRYEPQLLFKDFDRWDDMLANYLANNNGGSKND